MTIKIGLIARPEYASGLAIQARSFYENMPVFRVLQVDMPNLRSLTDDTWYPTALRSPYDAVNHTLNEAVMEQFLWGLDVVWTAETPYDWRMLDMARAMRIVTVIQGNPEFYKHEQPRGPRTHPTEWWWPSTWLTGRLPSGPLMYCPQPDRPFAPEDHDGPLRVLHTVGKRAYSDRNGTGAFEQAIRYSKEPLEVTVTGIDGDVPLGDIFPQKNVTWRVRADAVKDRWEAYQGQDVLCLPRRYGGNCLPALEAAACGLAVMMPDTPPNSEFAKLLTRIDVPRMERLPIGPTMVVDPDPLAIAGQLDELAKDRQILRSIQKLQHDDAPRWSSWKQRYLTRLENLVAATPR